MERIVVAGAGLAGLRACEGLRRRGFAGEIVLVGDEPVRPYDRPPLSKQFLAGEWEEERVFLADEAALSSLALTVRAGEDQSAARLLSDESTVVLRSGERLSYDGLVIATGARARVVPFAPPGGRVRYLRGLEDAKALRALITAGTRLLVLGGGFVGMEVAATARRLGAAVTVVELLEAPLARVLGPLVGRACQSLHAGHGVSFLLGTPVAALEETASLVLARLGDGATLEADVALVGVGAVTNLEWLEGSGLAVAGGGVLCDESLAAAPAVVAAGDVATWPGGAGGAPLRLEHRTNAAEQGDHAAGTLLGERAPYRTVPYVWSDQYDVKIQLLGTPEPDDECRLVAGATGEGRFAALYGRAGVLTGAVAFSMPRLLMRLRPLLEAGAGYSTALEEAALLAR